MLGGSVRDSRRGTMRLAGARLGAGMDEGCSLETWDTARRVPYTHARYGEVMDRVWEAARSYDQATCPLDNKRI
jgi:hypothetical protein